MEWEGSDLLFLLDGEVVFRSEGQGDRFPEPLFAVLDLAKINTPHDRGELDHGGQLGET